MRWNAAGRHANFASGWYVEGLVGWQDRWASEQAGRLVKQAGRPVRQAGGLVRQAVGPVRQTGMASEAGP